MPIIRWWLSLEAAAFGGAALVHAGVWVRGYEHAKAATAESVIGLVLLFALFASVVAPRSSRAIARAALSFALLGTLVGVFTIIIGIGPRSAFDIALHVGFVASLLAGLVLVARGRVGEERQRA
jgi:heme A synthase